ncbi:MAG: hypothetical protein V9H69_06840 [Anaerolineae bacterium]
MRQLAGPRRPRQPITATETLTAPVSAWMTAPLSATLGLTSTVIPSEAGVSVAPPLLTISADPFQVLPGDVISFSVAITNVAATALERVVLDNPLPAGVVYVAQSGVGFSYSPRERPVDLVAESLGAGSRLRAAVSNCAPRGWPSVRWSTTLSAPAAPTHRW